MGLIANNGFFKIFDFLETLEFTFQIFISFRFLEMPSSIGFGTASSVACVMGLIANNGKILVDPRKFPGKENLVRELLSAKTCEELMRPLPMVSSIVVPSRR
jgi:hypothetical protein